MQKSSLVLNIPNIQGEVKKIDACIAFQTEELRNQRKQLLYDSKCNTDLRCINFIRSSYLLQINSTNIEKISNLPFMHPNGFAISERLIEMAGIGYLRSEISRFLQSFFKLGRQIPSIFANIPESVFSPDRTEMTKKEFINNSLKETNSNDNSNNYSDIDNNSNSNNINNNSNNLHINTNANEKEKNELIFLPENVNARDLFACSTFPSLFSYCWTPELQLGYINTLVDVARYSSSSNSINNFFNNSNSSNNSFLNSFSIDDDSFKRHWLFDCIKCYIFSSNILDFIRVSIGDVIVLVPPPPNINILNNSKNIAASNANNNNVFNNISELNLTQQYVDVLINGVNLIFEKMKRNLTLFPKDVRILIKKFAELSEEEENKTNFVDSLFFECVVKPVTSNLIAFVSLKNKSTNLTYAKNIGIKLIERLWETVYSKQNENNNNHNNNSNSNDNSNDIFKNFDISKIHKKDLNDFYKQLITIDENVVYEEGPSLVNFLNLLEIHYNTTLFSVPDVCLLAHIIVKTVPEDDKSIFPAAKALLSKVKGLDFRFFRHETWDFDLYRIKKPDLVQQKDPSTLEPLKFCAISLYKFLSVTSIRCFDASPSSSLHEFLEFQDMQAKLSHDTKTRAYLCHLSTKIESFGNNKNNEDLLISSLFNEIESEKKIIKENSELLTEISLTSEQMNKQSKQFQKKLDETMSLLYTNILEMFLRSYPNIIDDASNNVSILLKDKLKFDIFFNNVITILNNFLETIAPYALQGVAVLLHSRILRLLPLSSFVSEHKRFEINDEIFRNAKEKQIDSICSSMDRTVLPTMLNCAIDLFKMAAAVETPLVALKYISKGVQIVNQISSVFSGKNNNVKRLMSYAILKANGQRTFSFVKYLEYFLSGVSVNGIPLFSEKHGQNLILYSKSISELDIMLCEI